MGSALTAQQQFDAGVPITRKAAIDEGLALYLGTRCAYGHSGWRYTGGQACFECGDKPPALDPRKAVTLYVLAGIWYQYPAGAQVAQPPKYFTHSEAAELGFEIYWPDDDQGWQLV